MPILTTYCRHLFLGARDSLRVRGIYSDAQSAFC